MLFFLAVTLAGCVTLYKPNTINSPLVKEKGQANASMALGASGTGLANLQAAYAFSDKLAFMVNGMYHERRTTAGDSSSGSYEKLRIYSGEAGIGYFKVFGTEQRGLFQCYGGTGLGASHDKIYYSAEPYPEVKAKFNNIFLQPGVAFLSRNAEIAFDARFNYVRLFDIQAYLYERFDWWNTDFKYYSNASVDFILAEPTLTVKAGGPSLKGNFQLGATLPVVNPQNYFAVNTASYLLFPLIKFSIGINYTFRTGRITETPAAP